MRNIQKIILAGGALSAAVLLQPLAMADRKIDRGTISSKKVVTKVPASDIRIVKPYQTEVFNIKDNDTLWFPINVRGKAKKGSSILVMLFSRSTKNQRDVFGTGYPGYMDGYSVWTADTYTEAGSTYRIGPDYTHTIEISETTADGKHYHRVIPIKLQPPRPELAPNSGRKVMSAEDLRMLKEFNKKTVIVKPKRVGPR